MKDYFEKLTSYLSSCWCCLCSCIDDVKWKKKDDCICQMADKKCFALLLKTNLKLPLPSHWSAAAAAVELAHNWTESKRSEEEMRCPKNNCQWKMRAAAEAIEAKEEKICKQRKELSNHQRNYCPFFLSFWSFAFISTTHKFAPNKERGCNSLPVPIWQWWWWW